MVSIQLVNDSISIDRKKYPRIQGRRSYTLKMKVIFPILSLLIHGSSPVLGLRNQTSKEQEAVCDVRCQNDPRNIEKCNKVCKKSQFDVPVLDFDAKAYAKLICQSDGNITGPVLSFDTGVYIIEFRNESSDWMHETIVTERDSMMPPYIQYYTNSPPGRYQWRLTRVFANRTHHGISRPEIMDWVTVREPGIKPPKVLDVWLRCLTLQEETSSSSAGLTATIGFTHARDSSCRYKFICSAHRGDYHEVAWTNFDQQGYSRLADVTVSFSNLTFEENYTVSVQPMANEAEGDKTFLTFSTPSRWQIENESYRCVPNEKENIITAVTYHKEDNIYDVNVSWHRPNNVWSRFTIVNITDGSRETTRNVSGGSTRAMFKRVEMSHQFNVSIREWLGNHGWSPEVSKGFTKPYETIDRSLPTETGGLTATVSRYKEGNIYDVNITWLRPCPIPNSYTVELTSDDVETNESLKAAHSVCGITTWTIFKCVKIAQLQFNVSITTEILYSFGKLKPSSHETSKLFTIPYETLDPSVQNETKDLQVVVTHHKEDTYDVNVTWPRPDSIPDFFIVNIISVGAEAGDPFSENLPGDATEAIFKCVNISRQFDVSIRAWSLRKRSPEILKHFTIPDEAIVHSGSGSVIIAVGLSWVSLVVVTGVCA